MRPLHVKGRWGDGSWTQRYSEPSASNHPPGIAARAVAIGCARGLGWAFLSLRKEAKRGTRWGCPCLESLDPNLTPAAGLLPCSPRSTLAERPSALASGRHYLPGTRVRPTAMSNRLRQARGLSGRMTYQPGAKEVPLPAGLGRPKSVPRLQPYAGFPSSSWVLNPATAFQALGSGKAKQTFLPKARARQIRGFRLPWRCPSLPVLELRGRALGPPAGSIPALWAWARELATQGLWAPRSSPLTALGI